MSIILTILGSAGALIAARSAANAISSISSRIMPFKGSGDAKRMDYQANINREQQLASLRFQEYLQEKGFKNQQEMTRISALLQRQTTFLSNIQNCQNALKGKLFDDALRHFPLNIPPLVMLQNAGMSTSNITGSLVDDPITKYALNTWENGGMDENTFYSTLEDSIKSRTVALSVFVTPLQIDARVAAKEKIASIVWDNVYQELESFFVKEYNRSSERPVIFYPGAWNLNARPGLHAAEILYFFTKGVPVVVLEPRFDGKRLRIMFSSWGVGMLGDEQVRQEISFDIDWNELILPAMYERSVKGIEKLNSMEYLPAPLEELKKRLNHNVSVYEPFKSGELKTEDLFDDISKLFYLTNQDYSVVSDMISNTMGMVMSVVSDIHHQLVSDIVPKFPQIKDKYFGSLLKQLDDREVRLLNSTFEEIYNRSENEFSESSSCNESKDTVFQTTDHFKKSKRSILDNLIENQ